jgi:hypothetical protein
MLVSSATSSLSYTTGSSVVIARLRYVAYLVIVEAESLIILLLVHLRVDLGSVEVHAVYIYCVNILRYATLVAIVMVVSFA